MISMNTATRVHVGAVIIIHWLARKLKEGVSKDTRLAQSVNSVSGVLVAFVVSLLLCEPCGPIRRANDAKGLSRIVL